METGQYAVVRAITPFKFTKFHAELEEAKAEAIRLSELEKARFIVLKVVGFADIKPNPVEWSDY